MLADKASTDWLDMDAVEKFCRNHSVRLDGKIPTSTELETSLRQFFKKNDEFIKDGVDVLGYERRIGWDLIFCIRFYRDIGVCHQPVTQPAYAN